MATSSGRCRRVGDRAGQLGQLVEVASAEPRPHAAPNHVDSTHVAVRLQPHHVARTVVRIGVMEVVLDKVASERTRAHGTSGSFRRTSCGPRPPPERRGTGTGRQGRHRPTADTCKPHRPSSSRLCVGSARPPARYPNRPRSRARRKRNRRSLLRNRSNRS